MKKKLTYGVLLHVRCIFWISHTGPGGTMVTLARAILYLLDENKKIKEERDGYLILSQ